MQRDWVVYGVGPQPSKRHTMRVSLNAKGRLSLNRIAYEQFGRPEAVELLVDERNSTIGLRPADRDLPHAYSIGDLGRRTSYGFVCRQFLNDHRIATDKTVIFPTARIEHGVLVLELKYRVPALGSRSKQKPA